MAVNSRMTCVRSTHGWLLASALCLLPACSPDAAPSEERESIDEYNQAISGGVLDVGTPVANAVVRIHSFAPFLRPCTGVLVAPDVVLTHSWCVFRNPSDGTGAWQALTISVSVFFGRNAGDDSVSRRAWAVSQPPAQPPVPLWGLNHNLAALRLDTAVPGSVAVPRRVVTDPPVFGPTPRACLAGFGGGRDRTIVSGRWSWDPPIVASNGSYINASAEEGDQGAPAFFGDANGPVLGIFNHPTGPICTITYGAGRPTLWPPGFDTASWITQRDWLVGIVVSRPDFRFRATRIACVSGVQRVVSTLENWGTAAAAATDVSMTTPPATKPSGTFRTPVMSPLSSVSVSWPVRTYFSIPGEPVPHVVLRVDPANAVDEFDEWNNQVSVAAAAIPCF